MKNNTTARSFRIHDQLEQVRFLPWTLESTRMPYELSLDYGLDALGNLSEQPQPFAPDSVEHHLLNVIRTGDITPLLARGFILNERPGQGDISRNVSLYDPAANTCYTLGGIGLVKSDPDNRERFTLSDPLLNQRYRDHEANKNDPGGTRYVSEKGFVTIENNSRIGVMEYQSGPYHMVGKTLDCERMRKAGLTTPQYIAAGRIRNLADGRYGFSIYRSSLTPDFLPNLHLFLDQQARLKPLYFRFLQSKYAQLGFLHRQLGETHGQPTNTNTLVEIVAKDSPEGFDVRCQYKDFATLHKIPQTTRKTLKDGICPINIGKTILKSPKVAAMIYDLQLALTQELNVLILPLGMFPRTDHKLAYLLDSLPKLLIAVVRAYGINRPDQIQALLDFSLAPTLGAIERGLPAEQFNLVLGGVAAHAMFGFSEAYYNQIEVR